MTTRCQLNLHDRKAPGKMVFVEMPRVPVVGDVIDHEDTEYTVTTVVLYTIEGSVPYVVARVPR